MCRVLRIDHLNNNRSTDLLRPCVSTPIYDADRGKIYFAYTERKNSGDPGGHNTAVYFREFDVATETFATPVLVRDLSPGLFYDTAIASFDAVSMVRTEADELVILYGDILDTYCKTSTDHGATWGSEIVVPGSLNSFQQLVAAVESPTGDVYCWTIQTAGGGGAYDCKLWKRAAGGTAWTAKGLFDDGTAGPTQNIHYDERASAPRPAAFHEDGQTALAVFSRAEANGDVVLRCYHTINDWAIIGTTDIKLFPHSGASTVTMTQTNPIVWRGQANTARVYVMWIETPVGGATILPYLAYTDDWGVTWTVVGTPPVMAGYGWDEAFDRAFTVDALDNLYLSVFTIPSGGTDNVHTFFRNSNPSLTDWTLLDCNVALVYEEGGSCGDVIVAGTKLYRVFNKQDVGNDRIEYNLLVEDDFVPGGGGGPEPEAPDAHRMFRRGVLQAQRTGVPQRGANAVRTIELAVPPPGVN